MIQPLPLGRIARDAGPHPAPGWGPIASGALWLDRPTPVPFELMEPAGPDDDVPLGTTDAEGVAVEPGSLGPHPERHPDDLPPANGERRRLPAGVLWALALALVVLTVASWVALSSDPAPTSSGDIVRLTDPDATVPAPGLGGIEVVGQPASDTPYTTFGGGTTSIAGHAGVPQVVNFWSSTCPPCIREMPALEEVHQQTKADVAFIGLAVTDPEAQARSLAARMGVSYELGFDPTGEIIRQFGSTILPTTVFIDADGIIVATHAGEIDGSELRQKIRDLFGVEVPAGP